MTINTCDSSSNLVKEITLDPIFVNVLLNGKVPEEDDDPSPGECPPEESALPEPAPCTSGHSPRPLLRRCAGITLAILSALFFTLGSLIVKSIEEISVSEMMTFRFTVMLLFAIVLLIGTKKSPLGDGTASWWGWMTLRGVSGTTETFLFFCALKYIPLADATIFLLSVPVFVFIMARLVLKEPFGRWHGLALIISLVGVALASKIDPRSVGRGTQDSKNRLIGTILCLGAIFSASFIYVALRKIRKTHYSTIIFNFAFIGLFEMATINALWFPFRFPRQSLNAYWIMALGVLSFYAQILLTKACQYEEAGVVSLVLSSSEALFAFAFQVAFFGEPLEVSSLAGVLLVSVSIGLLSTRKYILELPDESALKKKCHFLA